jgi:hypothetical protein
MSELTKVTIELDTVTLVAVQHGLQALALNAKMALAIVTQQVNTQIEAANAAENQPTLRVVDSGN